MRVDCNLYSGERLIFIVRNSFQEKSQRKKLAYLSVFWYSLPNRHEKLSNRQVNQGLEGVRFYKKKIQLG